SSTRHNLWQQSVITDVGASRCVSCGLRAGSTYHFIVSCNQISPVWHATLRWLGVEWVPPRGNLGLFEVFLEGTFYVECLVDRVKLLSWKWFLGFREVWLIGGLLVVDPCLYL
ncbi:hypothetical protein A2U01_0012833, partial [Trifolium medium]|nr:hypothetical protein [Trifolium medium]